MRVTKTLFLFEISQDWVSIEFKYKTWVEAKNWVYAFLLVLWNGISKSETPTVCPYWNDIRNGTYRTAYWTYAEISVRIIGELIISYNFFYSYFKKNKYKQDNFFKI